MNDRSEAPRTHDMPPCEHHVVPTDSSHSKGDSRRKSQETFEARIQVTIERDNLQTNQTVIHKARDTIRDVVLTVATRWRQRALFQKNSIKLGSIIFYR